MTRKALQHFERVYPGMAPLFARLSPVSPLKATEEPVAEAVVRVVVGQMLSRAAARSIYSRLATEAKQQGLLGTWLLDAETLRRLGLSRGKVRTVQEFSAAYRCCPSEVEMWRAMSATDVRCRVSRYWGMSEWTAGVLSIFYLGHEDVFPLKDGTLQRASELLRKNRFWSLRRDGPLGGEKASPYRSYLALYLWKAIDEGILSPRPSRSVGSAS